jgi:ATP-dependent helicase YprA (DUF1998 family)
MAADEDYVSKIRDIPSKDLYFLVERSPPATRNLSTTFLASLTPGHRVLALRLCLIANTIFPNISPRDFQIQAAIAVLEKQDSIVHAGTGYGKTLTIILPHLLRPKLVSILVTPLKRLQALQVEEFNKWGIYAVGINEDTPRDDELWQVRHCVLHILIRRLTYVLL